MVGADVIVKVPSLLQVPSEEAPGAVMTEATRALAQALR